MDTEILNNYITKAQNINLKSTKNDFYELKDLYESLKDSLNEEWKTKRQKFFDKVKKTPFNNMDSMIDDGFFNPLMKAWHYCNILCAAEKKCDKQKTNILLQIESKQCNLFYIEENKKVLDEKLESIKQQYCPEQ
jgi:hypothetical protein